MAISKDTSLNMLRWFKEVLDENLDAKLVTLSGGGQDNVIESISIDGNPQTITGKTAQLDLSDYAKKTDVASAVSTISGTTISGGESYTLPPATTSQLGGVIVGDGLGINSSGTLKVTISGGQSNVIESIFIDGKEQTVTGKTAQLDLSAYAKKADLTSAGNSIQTLKRAIETIADGKINVIEKISLDGKEQTITADKTVNLNLSNYAEKTDLAGSIRMKGTVNSFASLPANAKVGDLYNIKNAGTYKDEGITLRAGDNVVFTADGKWDAMSGYVDTSNLVQKVTGKQLSTNDFTDEEKNKLTALKNYTLERANATLLGGVMIGAGLSMTGDSLNATICNVFEGATSLETGDVGLVPAPKKGEQLKFLCSDGTWKIPPYETINVFASGYSPDAMAVDVLSYSSDVMTLDALSSPSDTQGTFYMGIVQDECCLKLFSGDYEYTFNPDVFDIAKVKPPPPADYVQGQIYYLNTAPSAANGTLWYTIEDEDGLYMTNLCAHREDSNYTFDFTFEHDMINPDPHPVTYYSYLPFKRSTIDLAGKSWLNRINEPVIEKTDFGIPALRNMDKVLTYTVSTKSGLRYIMPNVFPSTMAAFAIDFWLSWNEDTSPGDTAAAVGEGNTYHEILRLNFSSSTASGTAVDNYFSLRVKDNNLLAYSHYLEIVIGYSNVTHKIDDLIIGEENLLGQKSAQRFHIAITRSGTTGISTGTVRLFVNGKKIAETKQEALSNVAIFPYMVGTETGYRGLYIDHFRFQNKTVWSGDFPPPQKADYPIW